MLIIFMTRRRNGPIPGEQPAFMRPVSADGASDERRLVTAADGGRRYSWVHTVTT